VADSEVDDFDAASSALNLGLKAQKSIISEMPRQFEAQSPFAVFNSKPLLGVNTGSKLPPSGRSINAKMPTPFKISEEDNVNSLMKDNSQLRNRKDEADENEKTDTDAQFTNNRED